jgi:hypothetical protein
MRVVMGMIVKNRLDELKRNLYHNSQFFDEVIVVSDSSEKEMNDWLVGDDAKKLGVRAILDFDGYQTVRLRNRYLDAAEKTGWMLRMDVDEFISLEAGHNLRNIAEEAEQGKVNIVGFRACDIVANIDGSTRVDNPEFWCPNFFKLTPDITYMGAHHEGINLGIPHMSANVELKYYHIRSEASVFLRGARNAFATPFTASGVGNQEAWEDLRSRCASEGITEFWQLEKHLRDGTVPDNITEWFILYRNDGSTEFRAFFVVYYILLHPELNTAMGNVDCVEFDKDRKPFTGEMSF